MSLETPNRTGTPVGTIDQLAINTIRTLSMDAVEAAKSGHPGTPMALAPVAYTLWNEVLRYDPADPAWPGRDRFVLSCGHASMLLYSMLHLTGVKRVVDGRPTAELSVPLDEIRRFRQLHSRCPGHPESRDTSGVETTTGPLGQGIGNSVGMAIAQRWLAAHFNRPKFDLFDYRVFALCSDGDMMEGISNEAASLAGHLKLSNLCWIYDDNRITIEGHTSLTFSDDTSRRFEGLGWNVVRVADVNDLAALRAAYQTALRTTDRPTFIHVHSIIAWGAPHKQNTEAAHGSPLGDEEIRETKQIYGWPTDAKFLVPPEVPAHFNAGNRHMGPHAARRVAKEIHAVRRGLSGIGRTVAANAGPTTAGQLGSRLARVSGRRQGHGHADFVGQGAQRRCPQCSVAHRRRRRPGPLDDDHADVRRRGRV